jgi:hypothetical protein
MALPLGFQVFVLPIQSPEQQHHNCVVSPYCVLTGTLLSSECIMPPWRCGGNTVNPQADSAKLRKSGKGWLYPYTVLDPALVRPQEVSASSGASVLEYIKLLLTSTDNRSGITNDPNRPDDPEYIVRLLGQVISVSLETVKVVKGLPALGR